jgi:hypothetical protein
MTRERRIAARRRQRASDWDESGFTLVETMLGIVLLTFGLLAVADVFPHGLALSAYGQGQTEAADLSERWIEDLKSAPTATLTQDLGDYGTMPSLYFDQNGGATTAGNTVYTVDLQIQSWIWDQNTSQYVASATPYSVPGSGAYVYRVSAAAHWLVNGHTAFTSGNAGAPNGCVVGGAAMPEGAGCVQTSTFVTP